MSAQRRARRRAAEQGGSERQRQREMARTNHERANHPRESPVFRRLRRTITTLTAIAAIAPRHTRIIGSMSLLHWLFLSVGYRHAVEGDGRVERALRERAGQLGGVRVQRAGKRARDDG